jgi:hypothetical protein
MNCTHAYIGTSRATGKVVACTVDNPAHANDVANDLKDFAKSGLIIERVTIEECRRVFGEQRHPPEINSDYEAMLTLEAAHEAQRLSYGDV